MSVHDTFAAPRVVHVDPLGRRFDVESAAFEALGITAVAQRCKTDTEVIAVAAAAEALLCTGYKVTSELLGSLPHLRVIVRYGVGVDNVDLDAATAHGVMVCNVPDYCVDEVANHTMALLLGLNRRIVAQHLGIQTDERPALAPMGPLRGEVLGLIGWGRLARAVAERARPFGLRIVAHDPFVANSPDVELLALDDLLAIADYVSVHAPLAPDTHGLIGAAQLARMKPSAYIISTSRGGIIDEAALLDAITSGVIAGAGLDVWESEPVKPDNPLLAVPNVIGSAHSAYYSDQSELNLRRRVVEIAAEVLSGRIPSTVVNRTVINRDVVNRHASTHRADRTANN
ncbi:MAG: C-terminal binding protein [Acidimicrobiia bacterium]